MKQRHETYISIAVNIQNNIEHNTKYIDDITNIFYCNTIIICGHYA